MSHHRKRPEAPLDQFFRSVYDSLAKKVLQDSAEDVVPDEEARVAKDRRSTGARKAGKPLGSTDGPHRSTTAPAKESTDEPTVH